MVVDGFAASTSLGNADFRESIQYDVTLRNTRNRLHTDGTQQILQVSPPTQALVLISGCCRYHGDSAQTLEGQ